MTPAPHPKPLLPCPNVECRNPDVEMNTSESGRYHWMTCFKCDYSGPRAPFESEALRLHNALCAASGIPTEELEKLEAELRAEAINAPMSAHTAFETSADRLRALITRHRGKS